METTTSNPTATAAAADPVANPSGATTAEPKATPRSRLNFAEKLAQLTTGWEQVAPEAKFANMMLMEFQSITGHSLSLRNDLKASKARFSALVSDKKAQEKVLGEKLLRVVSAIRADAAYGVDSSLYRALGYVPRSERKSPGSAPSQSSARASSRSVLERYRKMVTAILDPGNPLAIQGIKQEDWVPAGQTLEATLDKMAAANVARRSLVGDLKAADRVTRALMKKVVGSVISNDSYGENSALYRAMGYIPANERKSRSRTQSIAK